MAISPATAHSWKLLNPVVSWWLTWNVMEASYTGATGDVLGAGVEGADDGAEDEGGEVAGGGEVRPGGSDDAIG